MPMIPIIDVLVLAWFIACWAGYVVFARRKSGHTPSLVVAMRVYRREWFRHMLGHENRIGDIGALNSLVTGSTFFASTSILILSGLVALLGTPERVIDIVADIPFTHRDSELVWKIKIILLICVLAYAFFKFSWSIRQFNFCAVLIGAAPHTERPSEHEDFISTISSVSSYASEDFNLGLRAFYFALAALAWFLHPALFALSSALVVGILYQREFHSNTLRALTQPSSIHQSLHLPESVLKELHLGARTA